MTRDARGAVLIGVFSVTLAVCILFTAAACSVEPAPMKRYVDDIEYQWEPRAGLCFAVYTLTYDRSRSVSITHVPEAACKTTNVERDTIHVIPAFRVARVP